MTIKQFIIVSLAVLSMSGCGTVTHRDAADLDKPRVQIQKIGEVEVSIAPEAYEKVAEYEKFSIDELRRAVVSELAKKNVLIVDPDLPKMKVEVTNFRIRSGMAAVWFGVLAGRDNLAGNIVVLNAQGEEMDIFEVSTSYMWGGTLGGSYDRISYLYKKFAENLADEFGT